MSPLLVFVAHLGATLVMAGLMCFIQAAHYPLMAFVGREEFVAYERRHTKLSLIFVPPFMLVEAATGCLMLRERLPGISASQAWAGIALLAVIWLSTAIFQLPLHHRLNAGFDEKAHAALVRSNWLRTFPYVGRAALVLWMAARALQA